MNANTPRTAAPLGVPYETALAIGARLKEARESLGRSPSAIAMRIKIREHYVAAIEQGQWNELPPGLNGRGLVRIYARELGVPVPELEPRKTATATHPHYEPVGQVNVISRQALMEREISRASQEIARSVPRNNGGNLLGSRGGTPSGAPAVSRYGVRSTTAAPYAGVPGGGGLGGRGAGAAVDPRAQDIIQRNAGSRRGRLADTDDEAPLDVVTPDVASILGLSESDVARPVPTPKAPRPSTREADVPMVSAETMAAEMFSDAPLPGSDFGDAPETQPLSRIFGDAPETRPMAPQSRSESFDAAALCDDDEARPRPLAEMPVPYDAAPIENSTTASSPAATSAANGSLVPETVPMNTLPIAPAFVEATLSSHGRKNKKDKTRTRELEAREREAKERAQAVARAQATSLATPPSPTTPMRSESAQETDPVSTFVAMAASLRDKASADGARAENSNETRNETRNETTQGGAEAKATLPVGLETSPSRAVGSNADWPVSGVTSDTVKPVTAPGRTTAGGLSGKALAGYTVAALALVGLGAYYFGPRSGEGEITNGQVVGQGRDGFAAATGSGDTPTGATFEAPAADSSVAAADSSVAAADSAVAAADSAVAASDSAVAASDSTGSAGAMTAAGTTGGTDTAASTMGETNASGTDANTSSTDAATGAVASPATSDQNVESSRIGTGTATQAKLTLLEGVEVQVTVDGKRIHSGMQPAGEIVVDFKKTAEIFVGDGSKVKLTYGTWDHGPLGHEGRKRRIYLNAESYSPPAP